MNGKGKVENHADTSKKTPQKTKHQTALNAQKKKSGQSLGGSGKPWKESD